MIPTPRAEWNSPPPFDQAFYGLSVYAANESERRYVKLFDYEKQSPQNTIVEFSMMRDDAFESHGFSLKRDAKMHIYAIGEGSDGEMYDYGWIVDGKTHKRVWEMDYFRTEHAGGARKNRVFDDVVTLPKGDYVAYYVTDGSHSYRDWNSAPPFDQKQWGMTIAGAGKDFDSGIVSDFNPEDNKNIVARLVRIRDHANKRMNFEIKRDGEFRIYALGEGMDGQMYDYAWLEDASTGRVVWEMTYRRTDHAGGARKNRIYNETISLDKGNYILYYESDDSHSFNDWNASPPRDPMNYGVTLYKDE